MFSLDTKQWESVATGLLSSVTKKPDAENQEDKTSQSKSEPPVERVAVLSDER